MIRASVVASSRATTTSAAAATTKRAVTAAKWSKNAAKKGYATEAPFIAGNKPSDAGQPLFYTHPHLVKPGELTEGIPPEEYERRRRELMDRLPDDSVAVVLAGSIKYMSQHIFYKFRQATDFLYLTGFQEPDAAVILEKNSSSRGYRMTMFCAPKEPDWEKWNGARTGPNAAVQVFMADDAQDISRFPSFLKSALSRHSNVYIDTPSASSKRRSKSILHYLTSSLTPSSLSSRGEYESILDALSSTRRRPLAPEIFRLRMIKSEIEQRVMRRAADISGHAHTKVMRFAQPGRSEADLAAHFEYTCAMHGAQRLAYVPVVASGANALTIHYTANNHLIHNGEMVLIDAGCEYNGYASDITRTFPVSGTFTSSQRTLYTAVLSAQKACIDLCTESGGMSIMDLHRKSVKLLVKELRRIPGFAGVSGGDVERVLYPHFLSHAIGMDLHETNHNRTDKLKSGMVITVEPGIYVPPDPQFPKEFHGMGVRIEDEVLVQRDHAVVLSVNAPKEVADVEGACQGLLELQGSATTATASGEVQELVAP